MHAAYALSWLRGPKCVASSSSLDRIRVSLESTELIRFFEPNLFSASDVRNGKPAPDLFLHAAGKMGVEPGDCIVVEDLPSASTAGVAAGMTVIGFVGGSHAGSPARRSSARRRRPRRDLPTCARSSARSSTCAAGSAWFSFDAASAATRGFGFAAGFFFSCCAPSGSKPT